MHSTRPPAAFKTDKDVEDFVAAHRSGLGRLVLNLKLADGRLDTGSAALARAWLERHPFGVAPPVSTAAFSHVPDAGDVLPGERDEAARFAASGWGLLPEARLHSLALLLGVAGVALLVFSAWLPNG
jgi:hypothetical protein